MPPNFVALVQVSTLPCRIGRMQLPSVHAEGTYRKKQVGNTKTGLIRHSTAAVAKAHPIPVLTQHNWWINGQIWVPQTFSGTFIEPRTANCIIWHQHIRQPSSSVIMLQSAFVLKRPTQVSSSRRSQWALSCVIKASKISSFELRNRSHPARIRRRHISDHHANIHMPSKLSAILVQYQHKASINLFRGISLPTCSANQQAHPHSLASTRPMKVFPESRPSSGTQDLTNLTSCDVLWLRRASKSLGVLSPQQCSDIKSSSWELRKNGK